MDAIYVSDSIFDRLPRSSNFIADHRGVNILMEEYDRIALAAVLFDVSRLLVRDTYISDAQFPYSAMIDRFSGAMTAASDQMRLLNSEPYKSRDLYSQAFKPLFDHALKTRGVTNPIEIAIFLRSQALLELHRIVIEKWCAENSTPELGDMYAALTDPIYFMRLADLFYRRQPLQISLELSKPILKLIANPGFNPRELWLANHRSVKRSARKHGAIARIDPGDAAKLLLEKVEAALYR